MTFGLAFGIWDYEWILEKVPPRVLTTWMARYEIEPWDYYNRKAMAELRYRPPDAIRTMIDKAERKRKARMGRKRFLNGDDIRRIYRESCGK